MADNAWELVPALTRDSSLMVDPSYFRKLVLERIEAGYREVYAQRLASNGPVREPEDAYDMLRRLGIERDRFGALKSALGAGEKRLKELMEQELIEAVGEQDGTPNSGLTVPDREGDIRLSPDMKNTYEINVAELVAMLVLDTLDQLEELTGVPTPDHIASHLESLVVFVVETVESWGKFEPQVSKVNAYADTQARTGHDDRAKRVKAAIVQKTEYKGVAFNRKDPT